jgi:hypothetical protein
MTQEATKALLMILVTGTILTAIYIPKMRASRQRAFPDRARLLPWQA